MIVVKIETWPGGHQAGAREIARIGITSTTTGGGPAADYSAVALTGARRTVTAARVRRHRQAAGAVPLVLKALRALLEPERGVPKAADIAARLQDGPLAQQGARR